MVSPIYFRQVLLRENGIGNDNDFTDQLCSTERPRAINARNLCQLRCPEISLGTIIYDIHTEGCWWGGVLTNLLRVCGFY